MTDISVLPEDIFLGGILPQLELTDIDNLVQANTTFAKIGQTQTLWQTMMIDGFPQHVAVKPQDVSWRMYYRLVATGQMIPLIYNGDRVGYIPYLTNSLSTSLSIITWYIKKYLSGMVEIAFLDRSLEPVIEAIWSDGRITIGRCRDLSINRILIYDFLVQTTIRQEILSSLGTPPIYGEDYYQSNAYSPSDFYIYDCKTGAINLGEYCPTNYLFQVLGKLSAVTPIIELDDISQYTPEEIDVFLKSSRLPVEELTFSQKQLYLTLINKGYNKQQLVQLLRRGLISIDHYIY